MTRKKLFLIMLALLYLNYYIIDYRALSSIIYNVWVITWNQPKPPSHNPWITFLNSKPEISNQMSDACAKYSKEKGIRIERINTTYGETIDHKIKTLTDSGNAPAIIMCDSRDIYNYKSDLLDLTDQEWVNSIDAKMGVEGKIGDKTYGMPLAVEGYGLIYNKAVLDKTDVDPTKIHTRTELENAFKAVESKGDAKAVNITSADWSLANHLLVDSYVTQSKNYSGIFDFLNKLKAGNANLSSNKQFNGLLDTFELMKKYNISKDDPIGKNAISKDNYEKGFEVIANKKVGFWFMGGWAYPQIKSFDTTGEYGFIPVPISNNPADYGNNEITVGASKFLCVSKKDINDDHQKVAKDFLNWLSKNKEIQTSLINDASIILPFKTAPVENKDPLAKSINKYRAEGKTLALFGLLPSNHAAGTPGKKMQELLVNKITREQFIKDFEAYWKNDLKDTPWVVK